MVTPMVSPMDTDTVSADLDIKKVIIIGAGGNVGSAVLPYFLKSPLQVSVLSRPSSASVFPDSVKVVRANYETNELVSAFIKQDAVVCLVASLSIPQEKTIIDAAVQAGVKWFIPSEFGSDTRNVDLVNYVRPYFDGKVATVEHLRTKETSGLAWTSFITSMFFDWGMKQFLGFDVKNRTAEIWGDGNARFSTTNLSTIGIALVNLLTSPERLNKSKNRYVSITSFTLTENQLLKVFERVTEDKWKTVQVDADKEAKEARQKLDKGDFSHTTFRGVLLGSMLGNIGRGWADHETGKLDNDLLLQGIHEDLEVQLRKMVADADAK